MKTAAIIPAFNEASHIGEVLRAVMPSEGLDEVIVVVDGATDDTARVAAQFSGVRVLRLSRNLGKGGAMTVGVQNTDADVLCFIDADLVGLRPDHLTQVVGPVRLGKVDMCVGVFSDGRFWSDTAQRFSPEFSGQRAVARWLFETVPFPHELRYGIEIGLNHAARVTQARVGRVAMTGVTHRHKEEKLGLMHGAAARAKMYAEMGKTYVRVHQHQKLAQRPRS